MSEPEFTVPPAISKDTMRWMDWLLSQIPGPEHYAVPADVIRGGCDGSAAALRERRALARRGR